MAGGGVADAGCEGAPRSSDASHESFPRCPRGRDPRASPTGRTRTRTLQVVQGISESNSTSARFALSAPSGHAASPTRCTESSPGDGKAPPGVHRPRVMRHPDPPPRSRCSRRARRPPPHASIDTACAPGVESLASCSSRAGRVPQDERSALAPGRPHSPPEAPRAPQAPLMRPIPSGGRLLHRFGHALRRRRSRSSGEGREAEPFAVPLDRAGREPTVDERFRVRARTMDRRHSIRLLWEGRERGGARAASGSGRRPTERGWPPLRSGWPRWSGRGCSW